jgi:hypothetical protein
VRERLDVSFAPSRRILAEDEGAGMDFRFTPEQEVFRDSVKRFAERHLAAGARERAHAAEYPWDVSRLMAKQGLQVSPSRRPTAARAGR